MNRLMHILFRAFLLLVITITAAAAINISHVAAISDRFFSPTSLALNGNDLAVLEPISRELKIYTSDGVIQRQIHITGMAQGLEAISETEYLFCDRFKKTVVIVDLDNASQSDFISENYVQFDPTDIVAINSDVYVLNGQHSEILRFSSDGVLLNRLPLVDDMGKGLGFASGFDYSQSDNRFYIFDQTTSEVSVFDLQGVYKNRFCSFGSDEGQITRGGDILCDENGLVYVSDRYQNRVAVFDREGDFISFIDLGRPEYGGGAIPTGMAIDAEGMLYVTSTENPKIDIFHIEKISVGNQTMQIEQVYPFPMDTVSPGDVKLVAQVDMRDNLAEVTGFDFRLYTADDLATPIKEISLAPQPDYPGSGINENLIGAEYELEDPLPADQSFAWQVRVHTTESSSVWSGLVYFHTSAIPYQFRLAQNFPNPFNPDTRISFSIDTQAPVSLIVVNILGQKIRVLKDENLEPGNYEVIWDGQDENGSMVASGVYFYRLIAGRQSSTRKMVLLK